MTAEVALRSMLARLDSAIEREILRMRGRYQLSLDEWRGLYVSDAQVDALLLANAIDPARDQPLPEVEPSPRWTVMATRLGLDSVEQDLLLAIVAPEIDPRYAPIFAYLNDDAARRRATPDLLMRLFGDGWEGRAAVRRRLAPNAPLAITGLTTIEAATSAALHGGLIPSSLLVCFLLGGDVLAAAGLNLIAPGAETGDDAECQQRQATAALLAQGEGRPLLIVAGRKGTGRRASAAGLCALINRPLAELNLSRPDAVADRVMQAVLACNLGNAALLLSTSAPPPEWLPDMLGTSPVPVILAVENPDPWEMALTAVPSLTLRFAISAYQRRIELWREALKAQRVTASKSAIDAAAGRFRLPDRAIYHAARDVRLSQLAPPGSRIRVAAPALIEAGRRQCAIDLGHLATRIDSHSGWDDLVLPEATSQQLRDFAGAASERDRVYAHWGMGKVGRDAGSGVAALFAGSSGTGKTMAAAVIARAIGLDLWRIDLSSVVSKYIGETEKNLERIFTAARDGDAILFFDEADALFGKRSEVRDAHDRYANVEVAYLLQRLEEHDGIAILASNLSRNIDNAFVRRLHYIIEFPLPDEGLREQLWRRAFARATPVALNVDHAFLAQGFALAGGDIRSAALDAAFLAASDGGTVTMPHILRAVSRQMLKQGKLPSPRDFGQWQDRIAPAATASAA